MATKKELAIVAQEILSDFIPQPIITAIEGSKGITKGTFKSGGKVFSFLINPKSKNPIEYKPFINAVRTDSEDRFENRWDSLSVLYLDEFEYHADAGKMFTTTTGKRKAYPQCGIKSASYGCGASCIGVKKTCRITTGNFSNSDKRLKALEKMAGGGDGAAAKLVSEIGASRAANKAKVKADLPDSIKEKVANKVVGNKRESDKPDTPTSPQFLKNNGAITVDIKSFADSFLSVSNRDFVVSGVSTKRKAEDAIKDGIDLPDDILAQYPTLQSKYAAKIKQNRAEYLVKKEIVDRSKKSAVSDEDAKNYKPLMTQQEAARYASNSVFGDTDMFHGATDKSIKNIVSGGVNIDYASSGMYGKGFYLTPIPEESQLYANNSARAENNGSYIKTKVNVKNPFVATKDKILALTAELLDLDEVLGDGGGLSAYLKANNFDSIYEKDSGYFVAFDGRQVATYDSRSAKKVEASASLGGIRSADKRYNQLKTMKDNK
jgi:hypothetical protein